ncbi:hypothetical protein [Actinocorallia libanotica]|uniref:CpXC motif protein n=1 Tax=Actinocorallia libanotica TaxID=46162 RepID=A0ABN1R8A8_9ACTN
MDRGEPVEAERVPCPRCRKGGVVPVMYGYPHFTDELQEALRGRRLVLGGCVPREERWACTACGTKYLEEPVPGARPGDFVLGVPVEVDVLRDGRRTRGLVTVRRRDPWTVAFRLRGSDDGPRIAAQGDDLFAAFQQLSRAAARVGVRLLVNGSRRDAHRCPPGSPGAERDVAFLTSGDATAPILGPADPDLLGTPEEQDRAHAAWRAGSGT